MNQHMDLDESIPRPLNHCWLVAPVQALSAAPSAIRSWRCQKRPTTWKLKQHGVRFATCRASWKSMVVAIERPRWLWQAFGRGCCEIFRVHQVCFGWCCDFLCFQDLAEEAGETLIARLNPYSDGPQRTSTLLKTSGRPQVQLSLVQQGL